MTSSDIYLDYVPFCDMGGVFASAQELGGLLDLLPKATVTVGAGFKYYQILYQKRQLVLIESGTEPAKVTAATERLLSVFCPRWVLSAGFAGGLIPSLKTGQVIAPSNLINAGTQENWSLDLESLPDSRPKEEETEFQQDRDTFFPDFQDCERGTLLSTDHTVRDPAEKKSLGETFSASLVDTETWSVAAVCRRKGIPFKSLRVILDPVDQELSPEVQNVSSSMDSPARLAGSLLGALFSRPSSLLDLYRYQEKMVLASEQLARVIISHLKDS